MNKLIKEKKEGLVSKEVFICKKPEKLKVIGNKNCFKILKLLSEKEMYPMEIAKKLNIHEQKVYYYIKLLTKNELIKNTRIVEKKGGMARYYKTCYDSIAIEISENEKPYLNSSLINEPLIQKFFKEFNNNSTFNGKIVVGSPDAHGPFKSRARDGHYAIYLGMFLGEFFKLPKDFIVKLDVDIKAEKEMKNNLIIIGGPGPNTIASEINKYLPVQFKIKPGGEGYLFGGLFSKNTGRTYNEDSVGIIVKMRNPFQEEKTILFLAGNKAVGTKACVMAICNNWRDLLKDYANDDFYAVIQGFDLDGDGKIDSIEVLEKN